MIKYILTLEASKYLKIEEPDGDIRLLPLGAYKVERSADIIRLYEVGSRNEELSTDYRFLMSDENTKMFNSAEEAETWFAENFFVDAPGTGGGGGGGTYTLNVGEQTIVASTPGQTEFILTGGATLPVNKVKIKVYKNTARLEQVDFTRSSSSTITLSSYWAAIVGDRIIISWVDLISA